MVRDLSAAIKLLFPTSENEVRRLLEPLADDRVRWAVLALSSGDHEALERYLRDGQRDFRDVLTGAENVSPEPKGPIVRALPAAEALTFRLLEPELHELGFFDRLVRTGALVFDPPQDPVAVAAAMTERFARRFGPVNWRDVPLEEARALLLHVMKRSFAATELARAPGLVREFVSFAPVERALASTLPDELALEPDGRPRYRPGPLNYRVAVVLLGHARAWGLWMEHQTG